MYKLAERDIIKICLLYYRENKTQQEISGLLGVSRFKINRLIKKARENGLVSVRIHDDLGHIGEIEVELAKKYDLKETLIVKAPTSGGTPEPDQLSEAGAQYILKIVNRFRILGVTWGHTLRQLANYITSGGGRDLTIVQLAGGIGNIEGTDTNILTTMIADRLGGLPLLLNAPLVVRDHHTRDTFLQEANIRKTLSAARSADLALLGIGLANEQGSLWKAGLIREAELKDIEKAGAVGAVCGRFYDIDGKPCVTKWDQRIIGLTLKELCRIAHKIGVARGIKKAGAISGALKGQLLDVLITDEKTALTLLR